jgi:PAS domain S-box-containing protein
MGYNIFLLGVLRNRVVREEGTEAMESAEADSNTSQPGQAVVTVLESMTDAIFALDSAWRFAYVNEGCERAFGRLRSELLGRAIGDVFPAFRGSVFEMRCRRAQEEQAPAHFDELLPVAAAPHWVEVHIYPSPDGGLLVYFRDISERPEAEEALLTAEAALHRQAELLSLAQDAILVIDRADRITFWNPAAVELYGWTREEALGRVAHELLQTVFPGGASFAAIREVLERQGRWGGELIHTTKGGAQVIISSRWALRRDEAGQSLEMLEVNRDITEHKRAEGALQAIQSEVEARASLLETVDRVALHILSSQTGREALRDIAEAARTLTGARYAALGVAQMDGAGLQEFVTVGMTPAEEARVGPRPAGKGILGLLLRRSDPLRVDSLAEHPSSVGFPPNHPVMSSFLGVPIHSGDTVVGSLYLTDKTTRNRTTFTEADVAAVEALGAHAAVAIQNFQMLSRQRALVGGLINAQEEERRAVAYDLHDGLTQYVMAAHARLESYRRARDSGRSERAAEHFEAGVRYLKEAVVESRRLVNGLRMLALDDLGLAGALEQMVTEEKSHAGWEDAEIIHNVAGHRFDKSLETAVYRVAQEALTNSRKHADARRVRVQLMAESIGGNGGDTAPPQEMLMLEVRDWGKGFRMDAAGAAIGGDTDRVGLQSMAERVRLMGGRYEPRSTPGEGTVIRAIFPLIEPAPDPANNE